MVKQSTSLIWRQVFSQFDVREILSFRTVCRQWEEVIKGMLRTVTQINITSESIDVSGEDRKWAVLVHGSIIKFSISKMYKYMDENDDTDEFLIVDICDQLEQTMDCRKSRYPQNYGVVSAFDIELSSLFDLIIPCITLEAIQVEMWNPTILWVIPSYLKHMIVRDHGRKSNPLYSQYPLVPSKDITQLCYTSTRLISLCLDTCVISLSSLQLVCGKLRTLQVLSFRLKREKHQPQCRLRCLKELPRLRVLAIKDGIFKDYDMRTIGSLRTLRNLDLIDCFFLCQYCILSDLERLQDLKVLNLSGAYGLTWAPLKFEFGSLRCLIAQRAEVEKQALPIIFSLSSSLEMVDLAKNENLFNRELIYKEIQTARITRKMVVIYGDYKFLHLQENRLIESEFGETA